MIPGGGCGKIVAYFVRGLLNTLMSCAEPGHPATIKVNLMSKSHMASTFWVGYPCRPICWTNLEDGTTTLIWVPSIAPIQSLKWGWNRSPSNLSWTVVNWGSLGFTISFDRRNMQFNTSENFLLIVYFDLWNLFFTWTTDWGAPIVHKNIQSASKEHIFSVVFSPYDECWNLLSAARRPTRVNSGDNRVTCSGAIALLISPLTGTVRGYL